MELFLDVEHTVTKLPNGKLDYTPFNKANRLVSCGWATEAEIADGHINYVFFYHKDLPNLDAKASFDKLQAALDRVTEIRAHNSKHDWLWLKACGFWVPDTQKCSMLRDYILLRGLKDDLSLDGCCARWGLSRKRIELVQDYLDKGITFDSIPVDIVEAYGRQDVQSLAELYKKQEELYKLNENRGLQPTLRMSQEFTTFIAELEANGVAIDQDRLDKVELDFSTERAKLLSRLEELTKDLVGATQVNLASPEQLSWVIYSRKPKNKEQWKKAFNLGLDDRGKPLRRPWLTKDQFKRTVQNLCDTQYRTSASQCQECLGVGRIQKLTQKGEPYKNAPKCPQCLGVGLVYTKLAEPAGLKCMPRDVNDVASAGFSTDKDTLDYLLKVAKLKGNKLQEEFLGAVTRVSKLDTYLDSFVKGIRGAIKDDGLLHANFNQCVTATGRLSSSNPNLQNQPRAATFPIRGVFKSRWPDGLLCESDFAGIEFRVAGHLGRDKQVLQDIISGKDIHLQTAKILTDAGQPTNRQDAKPHTYKPSYGGTSGTEAEKAYYQAFLKIYKGIADYQTRTGDLAIKSKLVVLPTGREYSFPNIKRRQDGKPNQHTMVCNYPVQGFATADIVPIAFLEIRKKFKEANLKSLLVLTSHDNLVADIYPGERSIVVPLMKNLANMATEALKTRYGITIYVPLEVETKIGQNLLDMEKI